MGLSTAIASDQANLSEKLAESVQLASWRKFASDIQATERCSNFFRPLPGCPQNTYSCGLGGRFGLYLFCN